MGKLNVDVPDNKVLSHQTLQLRVFDRATLKFIGSAAFDNTPVNYDTDDNIIRGKPVLNVLVGDPRMPLDVLLDTPLLDGLYYPVLAVPT